MCWPPSFRGASTAVAYRRTFQRIPDATEIGSGSPQRPVCYASCVRLLVRYPVATRSVPHAPQRHPWLGHSPRQIHLFNCLAVVASAATSPTPLPASASCGPAASRSPCKVSLPRLMPLVALVRVPVLCRPLCAWLLPGRPGGRCAVTAAELCKERCPVCWADAVD